VVDDTAPSALEKKKRVVGRPLTSETARELALKSWDTRREKAAEGMAEAVEAAVGQVLDGKDVNPHAWKTEAWKKVIGRATEVYMKSDSIRGMSEMASFIGKATGMIRENVKEEQKTPENQLLGLDDAKVVLQVFNFYKNDFKHSPENMDVIDAELNDYIES
jgi:hypothetical protein